MKNRPRLKMTVPTWSNVEKKKGLNLKIMMIKKKKKKQLLSIMRCQLTLCVRALAMTGPTMPGMVAKVLVIPSRIPAYLEKHACMKV